MPESRTKYWCFTINNPEDNAYENLRQLYPETCSYIVFQLEQGEQGTPHIQGYICLKTRARLAGIRRIIPRAHIEHARGTAEENRNYCTKEPRLQEIVELGNMPQTRESHQSDLADAAERIVSGESIASVARQLPTTYVRNFRGLRNLQAMFRPPEERPNNIVVWLHGPSGTGKSRLAYTLAGGNAYWHTMQVWWDDYDGQDIVVFDDFRDDSLGPTTFVQLLRYLDRYPVRVPVKGAFQGLRGTRFIFTTLYPPERTFSNMDPDELYQLLRRITNVVDIGAGETFVWPVAENQNNENDVIEIV